MRKFIMYGVIPVLILLGLIIIIFDDPTITSAAAFSGPTYTMCVSPAQAMTYINTKGCVRIYEDPTCQGAEVRCPQEETKEPAVTEEPPKEEPAPEPTTTSSRGGWRKRAKRGRPFYNFWQFIKWIFARGRI